ncbi:LysE family translocator [Halomonas cupida]|uniref:LysE family translocator n=1 Tax=Halomonas cupida TaxID=44933 RepID=UPI0039B5BBD3
MAIRNGMSGGARHVSLSSLGNITGLFLLASTAVLGLGVIHQTSEVLFTALKLCGAGYLIYLGVRQWRSRAGLVMAPRSTSVRSRVHIFSEGLLVAISNPKAILFFTALFPQFLDTQLSIFPQFMIMVSTFMVISFTTLMAYGSMARQFARWLGTDRRTHWFNRIVGSAFIGLGVSLLRLRQPV